MSTDLTGFVRQVGVVLAGAAVLGFYPLYAYGDAAIIWGVVAGSGICAANVLVGCGLILWAFEKPHAAFFKALFGGMAARLAGIGLVFFLLVKLTTVHTLSLTLSIVLFYVGFQVLEIRFLLGFSSRGKVSEEGV